MTERTPVVDASTDERKRSLAKFLKSVRSRPAAERDGIPARPSGAIVEATDAQQQIWLHAELAQAPLYNEPITVHFDGALDVPSLEQAFNYILQRHEAWRTSFEWRNGRLMQIVAPRLLVELPVTDLRDLPSDRREATALSLAQEDSKKPFPLDALPLFRARLCCLAEDRYRLYLTLQHIIFDGVSLYRIFLPELQACYAAFRRGHLPDLPPLRRQFADYALYQQNRLAAERQELIAYWDRVLTPAAPLLALPFDFPRPSVRTFAGEMVKFALTETLTRRLKETGEHNAATLFMTLLAAYHVLLYSYSGSCDQPVGTATSSRKHEATQHMLGLFLNTVVLRSAFKPEQSFQDLLKIVRETVVASLMRDDISFGELVARLDPHRVPGVNPLFQVMFSLEPPLTPLGGQWRFTQMDVETNLSKYDLHLEMDEREHGLIGRFIFSVELFRKQTVEGFRNSWLQLLELIVQHPERSVAELADACRTRPVDLLPQPAARWPSLRRLFKR